MFINTLPVRVQFAENDRLLSWLHRLQMEQAEMRQYEYSPLAQVQEWSDVPNGEPLFESIVVFENYPMDEALLNWGGNLAIRNIRSTVRNNYPLTFRIMPGAQLTLELLYDSQRFSAPTIAPLLHYLIRILDRILLQPDITLSELETVLIQAKQQQQHQQEQTFKSSRQATLRQLKRRSLQQGEEK
jgi:non-ribosomal peptide synthetase component F